MPGVLEWGAAGASLGDEESGDLGVVAPFPGGALAAVIDGLGHGAEAALAARVAASVLCERAGEPVVDLVERCHAALRRTRGAVMTLCRFDVAASSMTWVGVGNVEALLLPGALSAGPRSDLLIRGGVVGYQLPPLRCVTLHVAGGATLVMATDGVRGGFASRPIPPGPPAAVADRLLREHARGTDDALVLCARYLGGAR